MIGGPLMANPSRVTRGDAQAVLNAFPNAGRIIRRNEVVRFNTPADPEIRATIRPFSGSIFDGRHYCVEDWHVIVVAEIAGGDHSFSEQDARADLNPITLTFTLDGAELPTDRGPIKRFLDPAPEEKAFFFQQGALLSPSDLSAGSHSVSYTEDSPLGHHEEGITFFIDPPGQGACL
jgi:hypothetical protein